MSNISVKKLESLTKDNHGEILRESGGIVGRVRAGARGLTVMFRYEVWLNGKKRDYSLGAWPKESLINIRAKRNSYYILVTAGIDPSEVKKLIALNDKQ